ncbi:hypothetical protein Tco_0583134 [Tanacetum coccineum]
MKDVFVLVENDLDETLKQNVYLKDRLLEASLAEDVKNLVITSCVEIRNKDLHDKIKRISKESKEVSNESKTADTVCNVLWKSYRNTEGAVQQGPVRARVLNDLSAEEKERYKADIRATNILLQGIPKDIYSLINHYTDAKDIWDNVKMILEGSELTKDDRESQLYDEFEHFRQIKGETIHGYYVRFMKLINDMRNIKMTMPRMQLNSKFVNNMLPEWSRFITEVKLNRGLKESNFDQL